MERYGQRMNELMNLDSDASQEQFNYIEDYRPSVRVFFTWC
jgi:carboxylesterase